MSASFDDAVRRFHRDNEPGAWLRGVDHEDEVAGRLDRARLDRLAPGRPVRVQHHSGALWTLSSEALAAVGLDGSDALPDGVEVDADGRLRLDETDAITCAIRDSHRARLGVQ